MPPSPPPDLSPRKKPRQTRATATLDAIFEATIQVLVVDGPRRLTTTRVAARAGVSVGTMYQYFPHKQALFYALNERYLDALAQKVESACRVQHGASIESMIKALIGTYWATKTERIEVTHALYRSAAEIDNEPLIETFARRVDAATAEMLASAVDAGFADLHSVILMLLTTVFGAVRNVFERNLSMAEADTVRDQLILMCIAYLNAIQAPQDRHPDAEQG